VEFIIGTSQDFEGRSFDLCLIDGDHSFNAVNADFDKLGCRSNICAFHDINDANVASAPQNDGGVPRFWKHLKEKHSDMKFHEFISHTKGARIMGIGAALRNEVEDASKSVA
jgi:hypothetical protein